MKMTSVEIGGDKGGGTKSICYQDPDVNTNNIFNLQKCQVNNKLNISEEVWDQDCSNNNPGGVALVGGDQGCVGRVCSEQGGKVRVGSDQGGKGDGDEGRGVEGGKGDDGVKAGGEETMNNLVHNMRCEPMYCCDLKPNSGPLPNISVPQLTNAINSDPQMTNGIKVSNLDPLAINDINSDPQLTNGIDFPNSDTQLTIDISIHNPDPQLTNGISIHNSDPQLTNGLIFSNSNCSDSVCNFEACCCNVNNRNGCDSSNLINQMIDLRQEFDSLEKENRELRVQLAEVEAEVRLVRSEVHIWRKEAERNLAVIDEENQKQDDLLLNSLDQILFEKQKQVYLISGIHNVLTKDDIKSPISEDHDSLCSGVHLKEDPEEKRGEASSKKNSTSGSSSNKTKSMNGSQESKQESMNSGRITPKKSSETSDTVTSRVPKLPSPRSNLNRKLSKSKLENGSKTPESDQRRPRTGSHSKSKYSPSLPRTFSKEEEDRFGSRKSVKIIDSPTKKDSCLSSPSSVIPTFRNIQPKLKLDLKKNYDYKPKKTMTTPLSCHASMVNPWDQFYPPTPTPTGAMRPSLSLHNLASKNFTEVLIPSLPAPSKHKVGPPSTPSPVSPTVRRMALVNNQQTTTTKFSPCFQVGFCRP